jgi:hypothetical protein
MAQVGPISYARVALISAALLFSSPLALAQFSQQGPKLVGNGAVGVAEQGYSVALSADGNTAIVGGPTDNNAAGAAWVYIRSGNVWTQHGSKLVGNGAVGQVGAEQGYSVALSADGNTAIVGGPYDNLSQTGFTGAVWVYTRSRNVWTQQGSKLVGADATGDVGQGWSVAMSADGNTAIVGGPWDNSNAGAAWVYIRNGGVWTQQGGKLVGPGSVGNAQQGWSVALSADGNTAIVGGPSDNSNAGAAWVYSRNGNVWTQQGSKLVGPGAVGNAYQGISVALSADGNTAIVGGPFDNSNIGAMWVHTRSNGIWSSEGNKLVGAGAIGGAVQGISVALSADGNTAIVGGSNDSSNAGATWVYTRSNGIWAPDGSKLVGTGAIENAEQGYSVALSDDGTTAIVGGLNDNSGAGAMWVFVQPMQVTPITSVAASGTQGGPFSPSSFTYTLNATSASVNFSIITPTWLTASPQSGTVTTSKKTITFRINSNAGKLLPNTYVSGIKFNNTTTNEESIARPAMLTVNPKQFKITVEASPKADGTVSGGGTFAEGTSQTVTATPDTGHTFVRWTETGRVVSTSESYTFTLDGNVTLVAEFK